MDVLSGANGEGDGDRDDDPRQDAAARPRDRELAALIPGRVPGRADRLPEGAQRLIERDADSATRRIAAARRMHQKPPNASATKTPATTSNSTRLSRGGDQHLLKQGRHPRQGGAAEQERRESDRLPLEVGREPVRSPTARAAASRTLVIPSRLLAQRRA